MNLFYRRAVGFEIRADTRRSEEALVAAENHSFAPLPRERLRAWMSLAQFRQEPMPAHALAQLESRDLVYYSDHAATRTTTGAPVAQRSGPVALRGNVKVTPLITMGGVLQPLPFMPRRGSLAGLTLDGLRFHSLEMDTHAYTVTMTGNVAILRALLPCLSGAATWESLAEHTELLNWLDDCALLTSEVPARLAPGDVCWLGHAAVLAQLGDAAMVIDPFFAPTPEPRRTAPMPDWRTLPPIAAIAITHADHDHLHPGSLLLLSPDTPIIFPETKPEPYQVDAEAVFALLGFTKLRSVAAWQIVTAHDLTVTATPFAGEDWGLTLAQSTYVVGGPRGTIYCAADSRADDAALVRIAAAHTIDFAFLGVTGCAEPCGASARYGYGWFYKDAIDPKRRNAWIEHCAGPEESARAALLLSAKKAFGYAAGSGTLTKLAFSDRGTHAQLASALAGTAVVATDLALGVPVNLGD